METENGKAQLCAEARKLRKESGVPLRGIASIVGIPVGSVGTYESGGTPASTLEAYVSLLRELGVSGLQREYAKTTNTAQETDTAEKVRQLVAEQAATRAADRAKAPESALAREIRSFKRRTDMTLEEVAEYLNLNRNTLYGYVYRGALPIPERVAAIRRAMREYENGVTPRFTPVKPPATPPAKEPVKVPEKASAGRGVTLFVDESTGRRLKNGENLAPHLILDGKTLHVFTLVPGGVFVSYVTANVENQ